MNGGNNDVELRAVRHDVACAYYAAQALDDARAHRETQTRTLARILRRDERFENLLQNILRYPGSCVAHQKLHDAARARLRVVHGAPARRLQAPPVRVIDAGWV